eukprot:CAMPEP_0204152936 /NCGR_PEP_ID=MMETSP0361-20130328/27423_1 /ASSEMBLY_ACC=CAM_ASM_000343 /TAXON_ID=268821 /ORGANISM="Scrippsiella Hangoei, Strain SHTV-5" /LENGTH=38 /DNA_ID= /DNA_START= /DNA_END= /DNA_ORIENTATION=
MARKSSTRLKQPNWFKTGVADGHHHVHVRPKTAVYQPM